MNYIKRLQEQVEQLESKLKEANSATLELYSYCASEKFQGPAGYGGATYINKQIEGWITDSPGLWLWPHRRWGKDIPARSDLE